MATYYQTPQNFEGKTLDDIARETGGLGRTDVLAGYLGIKPNEALRSGQTFSLNGIEGVDEGGSAELQGLRKAFGGGMSEQDYQSQQAMKAVQPAINTLEGQKQPLKDRYSKVIEDIRAQRGLRTKQAEIASAREFGKRGIPLSSGTYDQYVQEQRLPVDVQFGGLETQAANEQTDKEMSIAQLISQLQGNAGLQGFSSGQQANQFAQTLAENMRQSKVQEELEKLKMGSGQGEQFATLGEGSTLFDLLNGKPVYTAPKTYKADGGGDSLNLRS